MTGDQRFFLGWAQVWRRSIASRSSPTGSSPIRTARRSSASVVRNLDAWYEAFDVKPGDPLFLPPEKRVRNLVAPPAGRRPGP